MSKGAELQASKRDIKGLLSRPLKLKTMDKHFKHFLKHFSHWGVTQA
jgi:hypothetical protein